MPVKEIDEHIGILQWLEGAKIIAVRSPAAFVGLPNSSQRKVAYDAYEPTDVGDLELYVDHGIDAIGSGKAVSIPNIEFFKMDPKSRDGVPDIVYRGFSSYNMNRMWNAYLSHSNGSLEANLKRLAGEYKIIRESVEPQVQEAIKLKIQQVTKKRAAAQRPEAVEKRFNKARSEGVKSLIKVLGGRAPDMDANQLTFLCKVLTEHYDWSHTIGKWARQHKVAYKSMTDEDFDEAIKIAACHRVHDS